MKFIPWLLKSLRLVFFSGLIFSSMAILAGFFLVFHVAKDLPKLPSPLSRIIETPQSLIYGANGQVLMTLGERKAVPLDMVSPSFINAIVATEDHRFFEHHGVNKLRTLKALYVTLFVPGRVEGASTITQQLAKNLFFSFEQSWQRKFKELLVALQIEAANTKEEILEAYVNQIHFGAGAQGIEKAAQIFFNKSALDLEPAEAILLAGLPKSPTGYNPFRYYERAMDRRNIVLKRMESAGFISSQEAEQIAGIRPKLHQGRTDTRTGSYFLDALIKDLVLAYGEDVVYHGGIRVYSTLDPVLQNHALAAVGKGMENLDSLMGIQPGQGDFPQGALVAIENGSGAVKAMVGGRRYSSSQFNRATEGRRQAGSGFKPFLYYAAFQKLGYHPGHVMVDQPISIPVDGSRDWEPNNFDRTFTGEIALKTAFSRSVNTIAAQLVSLIGPGAVVETAKASGVASPLERVYSIALGTSIVTSLDMAAGFSTFANLGVRHDPFLFWRVEDSVGRVLFERLVRGKKVFDPALAFQVVDMMKAVVDTGSARSIRSMGFSRDAAGKTGTTNNYTDAWFTGFTPSLTVSVWTGFDREKKLVDSRGAGITGGKGAAPIWADFMSRAMEGEPERDFSIPGNVRFIPVHPMTGCPMDKKAMVEGELLTTENRTSEKLDLTPIVIPLKEGQIPCQEGGGND